MNLSLRERRLLVYGALAVAAVMLIVFVVRPVQQSLQTKQRALATAQEQLQQMQQQRGRLENATDLAVVRSALPANSSFSSWIDQQLEARRLIEYVQLSEPLENDRVNIWLQNVPFDPLIEWLQQIQLQFGVTALEFDAQLMDKERGLVTVRMTLVITT